MWMVSLQLKDILVTEKRLLLINVATCKFGVLEINAQANGSFKQSIMLKTSSYTKLILFLVLILWFRKLIPFQCNQNTQFLSAERSYIITDSLNFKILKFLCIFQHFQVQLQNESKAAGYDMRLVAMETLSLREQALQIMCSKVLIGVQGTYASWYPEISGSCIKVSTESGTKCQIIKKYVF